MLISCKGSSALISKLNSISFGKVAQNSVFTENIYIFFYFASKQYYFSYYAKGNFISLINEGRAPLKQLAWILSLFLQMRGYIIIHYSVLCIILNLNEKVSRRKSNYYWF